MSSSAWDWAQTKVVNDAPVCLSDLEEMCRVVAACCTEPSVQSAFLAHADALAALRADVATYQDQIDAVDRVQTFDSCPGAWQAVTWRAKPILSDQDWWAGVFGLHPSWMD